MGTTWVLVDVLNLVLNLDLNLVLNLVHVLEYDHCVPGTRVEY